MPDYSLVKIGGSPNWYVQWFEDGHSRRVSTRTAHEKDAGAYLKGFILAREEGPKSDLSVSDVLDWYLATRGTEIADPARAGYAAAHLKEFYGALAAESVSLANQDLYAAHRRARGVKTETVRRELSVLSAALQRALAHDKITKASAILPLPAGAARDRWLTRDEAALLLRHLHRKKFGRHILLFTRLALYTGARTGAILDLTWDRVDFERAMISYPVPGRVETSKRAGVVPIEPNIVRALKAAHRRTNSDYVISWGGARCARVVRGFTRQARLAGFTDVTPHVLRHTFATWAAMNGKPLFLIGRAIGQSTMRTTERYAKHQPEALREVMRAVRRK